MRFSFLAPYVAENLEKKSKQGALFQRKFHQDSSCCLRCSSEKPETAKTHAENHPERTVNVQALTQVQPKELDASEIEVRIGATWVKPEYLEDFMRGHL